MATSGGSPKVLASRSKSPRRSSSACSHEEGNAEAAATTKSRRPTERKFKKKKAGSVSSKCDAINKPPSGIRERSSVAIRKEGRNDTMKSSGSATDTEALANGGSSTGAGVSLKPKHISRSAAGGREEPPTSAVSVRRLTSTNADAVASRLANTTAVRSRARSPTRSTTTAEGPARNLGGPFNHSRKLMPKRKKSTFQVPAVNESAKVVHPISQMTSGLVGNTARKHSSAKSSASPVEAPANVQQPLVASEVAKTQKASFGVVGKSANLNVREREENGDKCNKKSGATPSCDAGHGESTAVDDHDVISAKTIASHRSRMSSPDKVASSRKQSPKAARNNVTSRKGRVIRSTSSLKAPFVDDGGALAKGSTQGAVSVIGSSKLSASRLDRTKRSRGTSSGEATDTSSTSSSSTTPKIGGGDHAVPPYGSQIPSDSSMGQTSRRLRTAAGILFALVVLSLLSLNLARTLRTRKQDSQPPVSPSLMGVFSRWGIVGHRECGNTTRNILRQNGTVGDVAVAVTLCMCVALPNRCGIGGGLYAIYYSGLVVFAFPGFNDTWLHTTGIVYISGLIFSKYRQAQQAIVIDGHETAPAAATWKSYEGTGHALNAMYVGVPGQMAALETILNVTGTAVPWAKLFADAIALARDGFPVSPELAAVIASKPEIGSSALRDIFWRDGRPLKAGETLVQRALAATLHGLSLRKASVYQGPLAAVLAGDLHAEGGLLTVRDLVSYRANVTTPVAFALPRGHTLLAPRPPAGGLYLGLTLGVMGRFVHPDGSLPDDSTTAHRFVESLKFAFSRRNVLADPQFADMDGIVAETTSLETVATIARTIDSRMSPSSEPSYYGSPFRGSLGSGTAHFGFLAPNGDAIVVSSSLNSWFGSMVLSRSTGVIFNDVIRDFDLPYEVDQYNLSKTPRNQVSPGHRPLSTLTPSLVLRDGYGVAMAVSGSGGGRTISGIAQVVMRVLWMDQTVKRAVDWGRLHHQLIPDTLYAESTVSREIVDTLKFLGHKTEVQDTWPNDVMAMARHFGESNSGDRIYATYDFRRQTNNFVDGE